MKPRASFFVLFLVLAACEEKKPPPPPEAPSVTASTPAPLASASAVPSSSSSTPPETIAAQHVLVAWKGAKGAPKGVTRSKPEAKKRADEVAARAKSGSDFSALVAEYTDDEGTKDRQGNLGKFNRASKVKPFADAAFALAVGETSAPVESEFGYHVIKRNQ
jgi:peptidyl-prolyl cis-trans isomerase NIMA-interacting 1